MERSATVIENYNQDVLIFDVETDGFGTFNPPKQNIVQLAWIFNGVHHSYLIKGVRIINSKVPHKITVQIIKEHGKEFNYVWKLFWKDFKNAKHVVAHNIAFDGGIISRELLINDFDKEIIDNFTYKYRKYGICTMKGTTDYCKLEKSGYSRQYPGYKWPRLNELHYKLFGTEPEEELHDALNDCAVTQRCYIRCKELGIF